MIENSCFVSAGTVSITITLFNKAVFSFYGFKFPLTLFVAQMLFSLLFVSSLKFISPERFGELNIGNSPLRLMILLLCCLEILSS